MKKEGKSSIRFALDKDEYLSRLGEDINPSSITLSQYLDYIILKIASPDSCHVPQNKINDLKKDLEEEFLNKFDKDIECNSEELKEDLKEIINKSVKVKKKYWIFGPSSNVLSVNSKKIKRDIKKYLQTKTTKKSGVTHKVQNENLLTETIEGPKVTPRIDNKNSRIFDIRSLWR